MIDPSVINGLSAVVFCVAIAGLVINLDNLIKVFLCVELMFLGVSLNFIAYAAAWQQVDGQVFVVFVLTVAAAESAVGLGMLVFYFRQKSNVSLAQGNQLKDEL